MFDEKQTGEIEVELNVDKETGLGAWHAFVVQCMYIEFNQQSNETEEDLEMLRLLNENPESLQLDKVVGFKTNLAPQ